MRTPDGYGIMNSLLQLLQQDLVGRLSLRRPTLQRLHRHPFASVNSAPMMLLLLLLLLPLLLQVPVIQFAVRERRPLWNP